jgi:ParB-like chromosome segregation protein Spo0J
VKLIDPKTAKLNPKQAARHQGEKFRQLVESVRLHGFLQLPVIRRDGAVICGNGRILAWMEARPGEPMPVIVYDGTASRDLVLTGAENLIRCDYTPAEITELIGDLAESGLSQREIATQLSMDESQVSRHQTIRTRSIPALLDAYRAGLDFSKVVEISRQEPMQQSVLLAAASEGLSRHELQRRMRSTKSQTPGKGTTRCTLTLPSGTVVVSGAAMGIDELIATLQAAIDAARRANRDGLDIRTLERILTSKAKGGGRDQSINPK